MPQILPLMTSLGQVAPARALARFGISRSELLRALNDGSLVRVRRGWFATAHADSDQLRAISLGGRIGCVSALRRWGVWSGSGDELHVQLAPNASRLRHASAVAIRTNQPGVWHPRAREKLRQGRTLRLATAGTPVLHWSELRGVTSGHAREVGSVRSPDWIVPPALALAQALLCQNEEHALACLDSSIQTHLFELPAVHELIAALPQRLHGLVEEITPQAESGWETIAIRRVRHGGYRVRPQVEIPGVGRYDALIEECVGLEVNGLEFHSGRDEVLRDTGRVLGAQLWGLPTISINPFHIEKDWPATWQAIVRIVERERALISLRVPA